MAHSPWSTRPPRGRGIWHIPDTPNGRINGAAHDRVRRGVFVQTSGSEERMKGTGQTAVASIHGENVGMAWIGTGWSLRAVASGHPGCQAKRKIKNKKYDCCCCSWGTSP